MFKFLKFATYDRGYLVGFNAGVRAADAAALAYENQLRSKPPSKLNLTAVYVVTTARVYIRSTRVPKKVPHSGLKQIGMKKKRRRE